MDLYAENILDHFRDPRHSRALTNASIDHEEVNHACGDELHLWLNLDGGTVKGVGWEGTGCAISQASMSILSEELVGKNEEELMKLTKDDMYAMLGVPIGPRRFKCALMSLHLLKNTLHKANRRPVQSWVETVAIDA